MDGFTHLLLSKSGRISSRKNRVIQIVNDRKSFDELFGLLFQHERHLVIRAASAIERITAVHKEFLQPHKEQLLGLLKGVLQKELKWHLAKLLPRLELDRHELQEVWGVLVYWTQSPNESSIVRANALQALYELSRQFPELRTSFEENMVKLEKEKIYFLQARISKLKKLVKGHG